MNGYQKYSNVHFLWILVMNSTLFLSDDHLNTKRQEQKTEKYTKEKLLACGMIFTNPHFLFVCVILTFKVCEHFHKTSCLNPH